jgi:hypothetical protein
VRPDRIRIAGVNVGGQGHGSPEESSPEGDTVIKEEVHPPGDSGVPSSANSVKTWIAMRPPDPHW